MSEKYSHSVSSPQNINFIGASVVEETIMSIYTWSVMPLWSCALLAFVLK